MTTSKDLKRADIDNVMGLWNTGGWSPFGISNACGISERYVKRIIANNS